MRRFFLFSILFFLFFFTLKKDAFAASCSIQSPVIVKDKIIKELTINTSGLKNNEKYWVRIKNDLIKRDDDNYTNAWWTGLPDFYNQNSTITIPNLGLTKNDFPWNLTPTVGVSNPKPDKLLFDFSDREYTIQVQEAKQVNPFIYCEVKFQVQQAERGGQCDITFLNENLSQSDHGFNVDTPIRIKVANLSLNENGQDKNNYEHRVILRRGGNDIANPGFKDCWTRSELTNEANLSNHEESNYYLEIRNACNPGGIGESMACYASFVIPGGVYKAGDPRKIDVNPIPCDVWTNRNNKISGQKEKCILLKTAIGPVSTDLDDFIKSLFRAILGISGGIAVLLIMIAGYRLMASQGNPEKVKEAKESLTSAIIGLLFIIFSLLILQIIGVDVLRIPGLTR